MTILPHDSYSAQPSQYPIVNLMLGMLQVLICTVTASRILQIEQTVRILTP